MYQFAVLWFACLITSISALECGEPKFEPGNFFFPFQRTFQPAYLSYNTTPFSKISLYPLFSSPKDQYAIG